MILNAYVPTDQIVIFLWLACYLHSTPGALHGLVHGPNAIETSWLLYIRSTRSRSHRWCLYYTSTCMYVEAPRSDQIACTPLPPPVASMPPPLATRSCCYSQVAIWTSEATAATRRTQISIALTRTACSRDPWPAYRRSSQRTGHPRPPRVQPAATTNYHVHFVAAPIRFLWAEQKKKNWQFLGQGTGWNWPNNELGFKN